MSGQTLRAFLLEEIRQDPWRFATISCLTMFSLFTLVLSVITLTALIDGPFSFIIAIFVMLTVQTFATVNAASLFQPVSRTDAGIAFMVWLFLSSMSVVTNWGVWFDWLGSKDYAEQIFRDEIDKSLEWSTLFAARYQDVADDAALLADHSASLADIENRKGGTCGDGAPRDRGPRWTLRNDDAAMFGVAARYFGARAKKAEEIAGNLVQAKVNYVTIGFEKSVEKIATLYADMKALAADASIPQLHEQLIARIRKDTDGWPVQGKLLRCPDAKLRILSQRLLVSLNLPQVPDRPSLFEPSTRNAIRMAYRDTFGGLATALTRTKPRSLAIERKNELKTGEARAARDAIRNSPFLWALAALPDLMIVLASWRLSTRRKAGNLLQGPRSTTFRKLLTWKSWMLQEGPGEFVVAIGGEAYNARRILETLTPWLALTPRLLDFRKKGAFVELFAPNEVQSTSRISAVATVLEGAKAATLLNPCQAVSEVAEPLRQRLQELGATTAGHYELDRKFYEDLVFHALGSPSEIEKQSFERRLKRATSGT